jgi:ABC-type transporter MlaC component
LRLRASPLAAAELQTSPEQASKFVQDLGSRAVTLLAKYPDSDAPEFQTQMRDLIHQSFDLDLIGRFVLGATWQTATPSAPRWCPPARFWRFVSFWPWLCVGFCGANE